MSVSTNTSEQDLASSRKVEQQIQSSTQPEEVYKPPDPLEANARSGDSQHVAEKQLVLRNQAKDLLHSPAPSKKQRRDSTGMKGGVSYSSVLSLMPSRMSLRTLITPQMIAKGMFSPNQVQTQDLASSNGGPVLPSVQVATWEAISLAHCGKANPTNDVAKQHPQDLAYRGQTRLAEALTSATEKEAQKDIQEPESLSQCVDIPANSSVTESAISINFVQASRFAGDVYAMQQAMRDSEDPDMNAMNFKMRSLADMTTLAEHLLDQQDIYRRTSTSSTAPAVDNNGGGGDDYTPGPTHVDIGYIYTDKPSLDLLLEDGLVTQATAATGARLGTGIYTANNAFAGHPNNYFSAETESVGILVARLRGSQTSKNGVDPDTVVGRRNRPDEVVVLRSTCQCLPLVQYLSPLIELCDDRSLGNDMVHQYHCQLQGIIDECFNGGRTTPVPRVLAMQVIPALPQLVPS